LSAAQPGGDRGLDALPPRLLVLGFAVTGQAVARALSAHGHSVVVVDDHPSPSTRTAAELAAVELIESPSRAQLDDLVASVDALVPSPGIPDHHSAFAAAAERGVTVLSEFDLAAAWDRRPLLAVTGTDGKTTVTTMVTDMLVASGRRALAVGNTDIPLVAAIDRSEVDVFVVEASSFRLGHTRRFRPAVATWLNFAPDHLDVHASLDRYRSAKARIWADLEAGADGGVAVANADDPVVMAEVRPDVRTVTFGLGAPAGYHRRGDDLVTDDGRALVAVDELPRALPHDLANALAASATALEGGADLDGVRAALRAFRGLPHRVSRVGGADGIDWYDDSKATVPHAVVAAVTGFDSVVLIAGGRNKGVDLAPMAAVADHLRAVVAIGEAAGEVAAVFAGRRPVVTADSMAEAVGAAAGLARPGDAVILSPGCASFDWYTSYGERGDDFAAEVRALIGEEQA
jgi:UDP-N-acetylmuramoylalanine--D-glutamate ligase